ncbi:hypothetical protein Taro_046566 [Colocasia esculenta]|uniref:Uncharacterized protein n=1 Tax=Colocasia esculenta TaxID=4460 RepID=A0A843WSS0_COLES|nr:hypothetical protein [Colocasia esculenta]
MSSAFAALSLHQLRPRHASSRHHSPLPRPLFFTIPGQPPLRIPLPPRALPRRLFLPSASFIWDAITGGSSLLEASSAVRHGMLLFRQGDVGGSLAEFDRAIELDPRQKS